MDSLKRGELFKEFMEKNHLSNLMANLRKGKHSLDIPFSDIISFDPELGTDLLDQPEETIKSFQEYLTQMEAMSDYKFYIDLCITHLPDAARIPIWELRHQTNKFIKLEGYIGELGSILQRPTSIAYMCPSCTNLIHVVAVDLMSKIGEPKKCSCGRQGKFRVHSTELISSRKVFIEEDMMEIGERQSPRKKMVIMERTLNDPEIDKSILTGRKVILNGWMQTYSTSEKTNLLDTYIYANSIEFIERGWDRVPISEHDKKEFKELAKDEKLVEKLSQSILPGIYKEEQVKHALLLQMVGSENVVDASKYLEDRGCIHIALVGPPGSGKTAIAKRMGKFWPIYLFISAATASGRGLVAICMWDKQLEKYVVVAGAIPRCNKGITIADELDKMDKEEYGFLNNAMNDLKVVVTKAASATFESDTAILATLNPRGRVFLPESVPIYEQIELPPDLLDRFDLIFVVSASALEEDQRRVLKIGIAKRKHSPEVQPVIPEEKVTKYCAFARTITPRIPLEMEQVIEDRVIKFMRPSGESQQRISYRIFGVVLRLMYASARLHLREEVTKKDLNDVMDLLVYSYQQQGLITGGLFDFARVEHVDEKIANAYQEVRRVIGELQQSVNPVPIDDVKSSLIGRYTEEKIDEAVEKLKKVGEIMEPKYGYYQVLR